MKHLLLFLAAAALVLPATALGKGPSAATIDGPGAGGGISFPGNEGSGPLGDLTQHAGFFPAAFAQKPNPMLPARPKGELGPKYTITYTVPGAGGDDTILQDVYPYATGGAVTYTAPGQELYEVGTRGGWFHGGTELKKTLVAAGLPAGLPAGPPAAASSSDDSSFPTATVSLLVFALLVLTVSAILIRRRARPAAA